MSQKRDLLLIIDPQNVYLPGAPWGCPGFPAALEHINALLKSEAAEPYITRFVPPKAPEGAWETYNRVYAELNRERHLSELVPSLAAAALPVYEKAHYSALSVTKLRQLAGLAEQVVLTGVVAECCVLFTACEAMDLGCKVVWLTDAIAGTTAEHEQAVYRALNGLQPVHLKFCTTEEYMREKVQ